MSIRRIRTLAIMVLVLALLTAGFSAAAAEPLQPYFLTDQDTFLSWFREFDEKADYNWNQWQFNVPVIDDVILEGVFADSGYITVIICTTDPSDAKKLETMKDILRVFYESDTDTPAIEEIIDTKGEAVLGLFVMNLNLQPGSFILQANTEVFPGFTADEFMQLLEDYGLLEGEMDIYRPATIGKGDYRCTVKIDTSGALRDLYLYYYGDNAESGKAFFKEMSAHLLDGLYLEDTVRLVDGMYETLETNKSAVADFEDMKVTLRRTKKNYYLRFFVRQMPSDADMFAESMDGTRASAQTAQALDEKAFSGIDITAQITPTVLIQDSGVTVTALALEYGRNSAGKDAIGLRIRIEKEEGLNLDRIGIPVSYMNRWKSEVKLSEGGVYSADGTGALKQETTMWWTLDELKKAIPGFAGISSFRIGANLIPPQGAGETIRGEVVELTTGLPESPMPGTVLFSNEQFTINLLGIGEATERQFVLDLAFDNRGDKMTVGSNFNGSILNDFRFYGCDMGAEMPAGARITGKMTLSRSELEGMGITDLNQIESLKVGLMDYNAPTGLIGEILITREVLGLEGTAAEAEETILYENAGLKLVFKGLSSDGRGMDLIMKNESGDTGILRVGILSANGWQLNLGGWDFTAKAGENSRQVLQFADFIPDFKEAADIHLRITPCKRNTEYRINEPLDDQAQDFVLTLGPAVQYEEQGTVVLDHEGTRLVFREFGKNYEGDLTAKLVLINESGSTIRFSDAHDPLVGTSRAKCSINGIEKELYTIFDNRSRLEPGNRMMLSIRIFANELEAVGLKPENVKTLDFEFSLFPDADKIEYKQFHIHIE